MAVTARRLGEVAAPPLAPTDDPLDREHLSRITLGDGGLEREVLELFLQQAGVMLGRAAGGNRAIAAIAAHTLKGSARSIGVWRVALAAEAVEFAGDAARREAIEALAGAIEEARAAIERHLQGG